MQFQLLGYDGTDEGALERRLNAREAHLEGARKMQEEGKLISGGALLNDEGTMIGSTLYLEFESREALDQWVKNDPYTVQGVWKKVEITPIKLLPPLSK